MNFLFELLVLSSSRSCSPRAKNFHLSFLFFLHADVYSIKYGFSSESLVLTAWVVFEI